jgi:hypothetical protein
MAHINGSKTSTLETGVQGEFKRKPSTYRNVVKKGGEFPPEGNSTYRRTSISGTTFSGEKCVGGTIFHAV